MTGGENNWGKQDRPVHPADAGEEVVGGHEVYEPLPAADAQESSGRFPVTSLHPPFDRHGFRDSGDAREYFIEDIEEAIREGLETEVVPADQIDTLLTEARTAIRNAVTVFTSREDADFRIVARACTRFLKDVEFDPPLDWTQPDVSGD